MYFAIRSAFTAHICNETSHVQFCSDCKVSISKPNYSKVYFRAERFKIPYHSKYSRNMKIWPMSIGSIHSFLLHEDVVSELKNNGVSGVAFHQIVHIGGEILQALPPPPKYYKVEPLGYAEFIPASEKFELLECPCGIRPKYAGDFKAPFEFEKRPAIKDDFFYLKNYLFWVCVTKPVIDVLVKNNWTDYFQIGDRALPGMKITEFGETWYEDALKKLKISFPKSVILE
jgi:hypothetical protein